MAVRTSQRQFETMVNFMIQHGDLSRASGSQGRYLWQELTDRLNSDVSGCSRERTRWAKIWSDWKSKTNNKHKRLVKMRGRPTESGRIMKLTELEQKLVTFMTSQEWGNGQDNGHDQDVEGAAPAPVSADVPEFIFFEHKEEGATADSAPSSPRSRSTPRSSSGRSPTFEELPDLDDHPVASGSRDISAALVNMMEFQKKYLTLQTSMQKAAAERERTLLELKLKQVEVERQRERNEERRLELMQDWVRAQCRLADVQVARARRGARRD